MFSCTPFIYPQLIHPYIICCRFFSHISQISLCVQSPIRLMNTSNSCHQPIENKRKWIFNLIIYVLHYLLLTLNEYLNYIHLIQYANPKMGLFLLPLIHPPNSRLNPHPHFLPLIHPFRMKSATKQVMTIKQHSMTP